MQWLAELKPLSELDSAMKNTIFILILKKILLSITLGLVSIENMMQISV